MSVQADKVTGIIVTRGDCDLTPCMETWPVFRHMIVWDNSQKPRDLACFGRWAACQLATTGTVFLQDDDTIIPTSTIEWMMGQYDPTERSEQSMLCNMNPGWVDDPGDPEFSYHDLGLQAAGCLAPRDLWEPAVIQYLSLWPEDRFFYEWADFVVGILTPHTKVDLPYKCRDLVRDSNRLANVPGNRARRKAMMRRARAIRDSQQRNVNSDDRLREAVTRFVSIESANPVDWNYPPTYKAFAEVVNILNQGGSQ